MSRLKDRLTRLKSGATRDDSAPSEALSADGCPSKALHPDWDAQHVQLVETAGGSFLRRKVSYPLTYRHGIYRLAQLQDTAERLKALMKNAENQFDIAVESLLFLDTETTGLGIGAGNVPFLVGIGYMKKDEFVVEQLFIRHPGEELAMLEYLNHLFPRFTYMVSYNGKSFDWQIMKNRYVMYRLQFNGGHLQHLDFLYSCRSLWKNTLESCKLSIVEEHRLGIARKNDVPGSLAPTLYFRFLAENRPQIMEGVFTHNEIDILSLVTLAIHLSFAAAGSIGIEHMDTEEACRLAAWLDQIGNERQAEAIMTALALRNGAELGQHLLVIGAFFKKKGRLDVAVKQWQRYIHMKGDRHFSMVEPYIELAMYYEHKMKNPNEALYYAEQCMIQLVRNRSFARTHQDKWRKAERDLQRRIERLKQKLELGVKITLF
jgi:uncharacterized protein YprB with RNaseH-like and TPR domain